MKIILSIKPEFVEKIFDGTKRFEYRRRTFVEPSVKTVIIYSTLPVGKVVGEFEIGEIMVGISDVLWECTSDYSGVSRERFDKYFEDKKYCTAIAIKNPIKYDIPMDIRTDFNMIPPQSFAYIK